MTDPFVELGKPGCDGLCFAITPDVFRDEYADNPGNFPSPDYVHAIFRHEVTGCFIVQRPNARGRYWWPAQGEKLTRIR